MTEQIERRRGLLYGRRKGPRLSAHQAHLRETLLPQLTLHLERGRDPRTYFSPLPCGEVDALRDSEMRRVGDTLKPPPGSLRSPTSPQGGGERKIEDVWLEIGYGGGEHLLWQAEQNPKIGLIGAEPYEGGTAKLLSKLEVSHARNIRLHEGDAREIIDALPDASLGRVFILFPDPWPKTRHHKRRFIQMELLDRLAQVMKSGAELRFATDDRSYLVWALERIAAHPMFEWTAERAADWMTRPADWPQTRYEAKAIKGPPTYLRFARSATL
jgi:tRNA (guanine-N7-)-methyltransferase